MKVLLDLNVVLDVLLARKQFFESAEVLLLAEEGKIDACFPLHGIATIYYFCRKEMSDGDARAQLKKLRKALKIACISDDEVGNAIDSSMADFEDAIVMQTAKAVGAEYILTRNVRDYEHSSIRAIAPREFLERYFPPK